MNQTISRLQPNTTQIPNYLIDDIMPLISPVAFQVLIIIARQTYGWVEDPITGRRKEKDWISYSQFTKRTGKETQAIAQALRELTSKDLIEVLDQKGIILKTKQECIGKKLFYRIKTSLIIKEETPNLFENQNLKIKDTKETYTKALSKDKGGVTKKLPSCPLLNGSPLKEKYTNGHNECVEYVTSEEEDRHRKFINKAKQFQAIHKILRAGYGFEVMDKTLRAVEKKYGKGSWDYTTLSNWIEKGAGYGN